MSATLAHAYSTFATLYSHTWSTSTSPLPHTTLENELVHTLLSPCTSLTILDLGGGSGGHARRALSLGATHVSVVDISAGMLDVGRQITTSSSSSTPDLKDSISWQLGNAFQPLGPQVPALEGREGTYDIVMAIWPFDHAESDGELEGLWENIGRYLRDGGRVVGVRVGNPWAASARSGRYGSRFNDVERVEGGVRFTYTMLTEPAFTLAASSREKSYGGSTEMAEKVGIRDVKVFDIRETKTVKGDPEFWEEMVKDLHFVGFTRVKREVGG